MFKLPIVPTDCLGAWCLAHFTTSKPSTCDNLLYATFWSTAFVIDWKAFCEELSHKLTSPLLTMLFPQHIALFMATFLIRLSLSDHYRLGGLDLPWNRTIFLRTWKWKKTCGSPILSQGSKKLPWISSREDGKVGMFFGSGNRPCVVLGFAPGYWSDPYSALATPRQGPTVKKNGGENGDTTAIQVSNEKESFGEKTAGFLYVLIFSNRFRHSKTGVGHCCNGKERVLHHVSSTIVVFFS